LGVLLLKKHPPNITDLRQEKAQDKAAEMDALRAKRPATQWGLIESALGGTNRFSCGVNIMLYMLNIT
jgi:hypothetical protein